MRPSATQALESVVASDCASWDPLVGRGGKTDSCHSKTLIALIILSPETAANIPPKHLLTIFYLWNRHRSGIWTHMCKKSSNSNKFHSKIIGTKVWNSHRGRGCSGVSSSSPSVSTKEFLTKLSFGQNFTFQIWLKNLFSAWFTFDLGCSGSGFRFFVPGLALNLEGHCWM